MKKRRTIKLFLAILLIGSLFALTLQADPEIIQRIVLQPRGMAPVEQSFTHFKQLIPNRTQDLALEPIGLVAIPELGINLPIFEGAEKEQLEQGAGTAGSSDFSSANFSIAAHHVLAGEGKENWLFSPLVNAQAGQLVYTMDESQLYLYQITESFVVDVYDAYVLDEVPGEHLLTLIYCTGDQPDHRSIVRATFQSSKAISEMTAQEIQYFQREWNQIPAGVDFSTTSTRALAS